MSWSHTPRLPILVWAIWTFPFTIWDTAYIFLRPHSLPGSKWHRPFFEPMVRWATVDHVYGEQAWLENEGFTAAQGVINMLEVTLYMIYFGIVQSNGTGFKGGSFGGRSAALAVLVGFGAGVVTATKTSLYFMREVFSDFKYTCHNEQHPIFTLWGFMNFLYFSAASYMIFAFGRDIFTGLSLNSELESIEVAKKRKTLRG